jgi:regulator of protease activity HflC (stomatin/prohibitin superfamily)
VLSWATTFERVNGSGGYWCSDYIGGEFGGSVYETTGGVRGADQEVLRVGAVVAVLASLAVLVPVVFVHQGDLGIVYRFGKLVDRTLEPGLNIVLPIDDVHHVQVTEQTDSLSDVNCGTNDGATFAFKVIEIVNQLNSSYVRTVVANYKVNYDQPLIFQALSHEVGQMCSGMSFIDLYINKFDQLDETLTRVLQHIIDGKPNAFGLRILSIRVIKPTQLAGIAYELLAQHIAYAKERATTYATNNRTLSMVAANRTRALEVLKSDTDQELQKIAMTAEMHRANLSSTQNQSLAALESQRLLALADIETKRSVQEASLNAQKDAALLRLGVRNAEILVEERNLDVLHKQRSQEIADRLVLYNNNNYVQIEFARYAYSNVTKYYYGDRLPTMGVDIVSRMLGHPVASVSPPLSQSP